MPNKAFEFQFSDEKRMKIKNPTEYYLCLYERFLLGKLWDVEEELLEPELVDEDAANHVEYGQRNKQRCIPDHTRTRAYERGLIHVLMKHTPEELMNGNLEQ